MKRTLIAALVTLLLIPAVARAQESMTSCQAMGELLKADANQRDSGMGQADQTERTARFLDSIPSNESHAEHVKTADTLAKVAYIYAADKTPNELYADFVGKCERQSK
jgi:hypothetical protein